MRGSHALNRPIPWRVVLLAWWFMSGRARRQKQPSTETRLARTWTRTKYARATHVKAPIGQAIRWALYDWRPHWTEVDLVQATAEVTRRIDERRARRVRDKSRLRAREYRTAFSAELRSLRAKHAGQDALATTDRYLARVGLPEPIAPALAREIRARVFKAPEQAKISLHIDGRWWSSEAAYAAWKAKPAPRSLEVHSNIITARNEPPRAQSVSMGELARLAADMNGRRI